MAVEHVEQLRDVLARLVAPVVADHGAELVDVEVIGGRNNHVVRLLVHRDPAIPVTVCEAISREVGDLLDVEDPMPGRYRLEVTSPGLGRPLHSDRDYARAAGRLVKVVAHTGHTWTGKLAAWDAEGLTLDLAPPGGSSQRIQRRDVAKAVIVPEL